MTRTSVPPEFQNQDKITDKQLAYIGALLYERVVHDKESGERLDGPALARLEDEAESLTKKQASKWIERLLRMPYLPRSQQPRSFAVPNSEVLPAGRYAVESEDGELRFYRVWRGDRNPNYVNLYVQHGPDQSKVEWKAVPAILRKIVQAGPREAAIRYGHEIGACAVCGTRLTNTLSRELGIGPVCGGRFWSPEEWKSTKQEARETIRARGEDPEDGVTNRVGWPD